MLRQCGASKYNRCKVPEGITLTDDNFHKEASEWLNHRFFKRCNYCQDTNVHFSNPLQPQPPSLHRVRSPRRFSPPSSPTIEPVPPRRSHRARRTPAHFDSSPHDAEPKMCRKCEATKPLNEFSHEGSVLHSFCNACCLDLVEESRLRRIRGMPDSESSGLHD